MREILFRGKRIDNGEWITGYYTKQSNHACFANELKYTHFIYKDVFMDWSLGGLCKTEVDPETVGQCTGLSDENGKMIFEGDIVCFARNIYQIVFECGSFHLCDKSGKMIQKVGGMNDYCYPLSTLYDQCCWEVDWAYDIKIIGNIYDTPELLRSETE